MNAASILVVDDDIDILDLAQCYFSAAGMEVVCAANGAEALEKAKNKRYTVIITDYNMPGMDGIVMTEKLLSAAPDTPVIMITGTPSQGLADQASAAGIKTIVSKPLNLEKLLSVVQELTKSTA